MNGMTQAVRLKPAAGGDDSTVRPYFSAKRAMMDSSLLPSSICAASSANIGPELGHPK